MILIYVYMAFCYLIAAGASFEIKSEGWLDLVVLIIGIIFAPIVIPMIIGANYIISIKEQK
tara:strand:+ start:4720 stop:4902 length:183 start_codon:yes stop_codon:yes gene_type:complete